MDNELIIGDIFRKFGAGGEMKFRLFFGVFPDPVWKFFGSDVPALAMVGAALRDQDLITILDRIQSPRAVDGLGEISFISRKQDRKRGQADLFRSHAVHERKDLAVRDDERRLFL